MSKIEIGERVAALEVRTEHHEDIISTHSEHLKALDTTIVSLVAEVRQIRNALYFMASMLAVNVPAVKDIFMAIKHILGM